MKATTGTSAEQTSTVHKKCVDYVKRADEKARTNEYLHIVKGFFEIAQGEAKRAEDCFKYVYERGTKAQNVSRKRFLFAALVGLGIVAFAQNRPKATVDHLSKAIALHPGCDPSVRTAIAAACFKLDQFDRAKSALTKAASLQADVPQLVLWALLKLVEANKDKAGRSKLRQQAFDLAFLAHNLDPMNASALNLLANHRFHAWQSVPLTASDTMAMDVDSSSYACMLVEGDVMRLSAAVELLGCKPGNQLRLHLLPGKPTVHTITAIAANAEGGGELEVRFTPPVAAHGLPLQVEQLELKNLLDVAEFAQRALAATTVKAVRAESCYILGKVAHTQGDAKTAYAYYGEAIAEVPDMALAAYGAAQIVFAGKDYDKALELFEKVHKVTPDDKDTLAYVTLLRGIQKGQAAPLDKLRECSAGFQFEVDLWLSQAQLRHRLKTDSQVDHLSALRCYSHAVECMKAGRQAVPDAVLNNMGVLYYALGNKDKALECIVEVMGRNTVELAQDGTQWFLGAEVSDLAHRVAADPLCMGTLLAAPHSADGGPSNSIYKADDDVDLSAFVAPGARVLVGDCLVEVDAVNGSELICLPAPRAISSSTAQHLPLRTIAALDLTADGLQGYAFNLARVLEDLGHTSSAVELYSALVKKHPALLDCYLRLSAIARSLGQLDTATSWLHRAQRCREDSVEIAVGFGDLMLLTGKSEEAKKAYEKVYVKHRKDPQALLSQGNYYYSSYLASGDAKHLHSAYKFLYPVLQEHHRNIYAANGVAIVCAEKKELDAAREIFNKVREAGHALIADDACINLAHVHVADHRYLDAERLYLAALKNLNKSTSGTAEVAALLLELIANVQVKANREAEARKTMLRALHLNPMLPSTWLNTAAVCEHLHLDEQHKDKARRNDGSSVRSMQDQLRHVQFAKKLLSWCTSNTAQRMMRAGTGSKKEFQHRVRCAEERAAALSKRIQQSQQSLASGLESRKRSEEEHAVRMHEKSQIRALEEQEREQAKKLAQSLAEEQEKRLERMRDKWSTPASQSQSEDADGAQQPAAKKRKKAAVSKTSAVAQSDEEPDDIPEPPPPPPLSDSEDVLAEIFGDDDDDDDGGDDSNPSKRSRSNDE